MNVTGYLSLILAVIARSATLSLLTGDNAQNSTSHGLVKVSGENANEFRQLLKQETISRMTLIQAMMKDVLTLKASTDHEISVLKTEVQTLKKEVQTLKKEVQTLKTEVQTLKTEVQTLKKENTTLRTMTGLALFNSISIVIGLELPDIQIDITF
jgi:peptidoglycan hydrolase CwlO-like protein